MDYHNEIIKEKDIEIKKLVGEIEKLGKEIESLQIMLTKYKVCEEEKTERIRYLENILTYLEGRLVSGQR